MGLLLEEGFHDSTCPPQVFRQQDRPRFVPPRGMGGLMALEPLILMLLMCRQYMVSGTEEERDLLRAYRRHLTEALGSSSAGLVGRISSEEGLPKATEVLRNFVALCRAQDPLEWVS